MISHSRRRKPVSPVSWGAALLAVIVIIATWVHYHFFTHSAHPHPVSSASKRLPTQVKTWDIVEATPLNTPRLPFKIGETSGILWNLNTHQLLWQLHPHTPGPLASTTKLMTIYLILHHLALSRVITISPAAAATSGSDIYMAPGEHFTVNQLLYGLMLASANDASVALAQSMAGSQRAFVREMNHQARIFGMNGTHYADPDGLSPQSIGTAWDLSIIAEQDLRNPLFRHIVDTKITHLPHNPIVRNLNGLLFIDPSVIGIKTGWTTKAGFNLVFAATRQVRGHSVTLLGVILHAQHGFPPEYQDAEKILNWGFQQVSLQTASPHHGLFNISTTAPGGKVPVTKKGSP